MNLLINLKQTYLSKQGDKGDERKKGYQGYAGEKGDKRDEVEKGYQGDPGISKKELNSI